MRRREEGRNGIQAQQWRRRGAAKNALPPPPTPDRAGGRKMHLFPPSFLFSLLLPDIRVSAPKPNRPRTNFASLPFQHPFRANKSDIFSYTKFSPSLLKNRGVHGFVHAKIGRDSDTFVDFPPVEYFASSPPRGSSGGSVSLLPGTARGEEGGKGGLVAPQFALPSSPG